MNDIDVSELLDLISELSSIPGAYDELMSELAGVFKIVGVVGLVIGGLGCFLGFNLLKFFIALSGFNLGCTIGLVLTIAKEDAKMLVVGLVLGIVLAIVSYKLYKMGVFLVSFMSSGTIGLLIGLIATQEFKTAMIIAVIFGIIVGIISVIFTKPAIIISTAVSFGSICGSSLALIMSNSSISVIASVIFIVLGILSQMKINNGLFEKKPQPISNSGFNA